jgi:hypothetical protein
MIHQRTDDAVPAQLGGHVARHDLRRFPPGFEATRADEQAGIAQRLERGHVVAKENYRGPVDIERIGHALSPATAVENLAKLHRRWLRSARVNLDEMNNERLIAWFKDAPRLFGIHGRDEAVNTYHGLVDGFLLTPIQISAESCGFQNVKIGSHKPKNGDLFSASEASNIIKRVLTNSRFSLTSLRLPPVLGIRFKMSAIR